MKPEIENWKVYLFYPPLYLHTGIIGPGNDSIKHIEKYVDLTEFKARYSMKGHGPGRDQFCRS